MCFDFTDFIGVLSEGGGVLMENLKAYLLGIAAVAMAVSMAAALLREDALKKAVRLAGGMVLVLVVLGPLVRTNLDAFGQYLSKIQMDQDALASGIEVEDKALMARIIQDKTEAYILDKAEALGAEVQVTVVMEKGVDYPYPGAVTVEGVLTAAQRSALSADLEQSLAIPRERQEFLP